VLRQHDWLPVRQRITLKLAMMTFKCLHGLSPPYTCLMYVFPFRPSSSAGGSCGRPTAGQSSCRTPGLRWQASANFAMSGSATWNSLPVELRTSSPTIDAFAKKNSKFIRWMPAPFRQKFAKQNHSQQARYSLQRINYTGLVGRVVLLIVHKYLSRTFEVNLRGR